MAAKRPQPKEDAGPPAETAPSPRRTHRGRGLSIAVGILYILAGCVSIAFPFVSSLAVTLVIGWLLAFVGIVAIIHAFGVKGWRGALWFGFIGLVLLIGGGLLIAEPLAGTMSLTALLASILIIEGVIEIFAAFSLLQRSNWGWVLMSGIVALGAGLVITFALPASALWVLGSVVGVNLMFSGISYITDPHDDSFAPPPRLEP